MEFVTEQFSYQDAVTLDRLVREYTRPNMVVFELGTYTGRASLVMLPHIRRMNGMLYGVDWFRGNPGTEAAINTSYQVASILDILLNNIREGGYEDYVTVLVGTTDDVASIVADESADFIFIDADHRYTQIRNDILNWYPKLKDGGLICGHDFEKHLKECDFQRVLEMCEEDYIDGCHYGVIRAVSEFFPDVQREGRIWYARKGSYDRPLLDSALAARGASRFQGESGEGNIQLNKELGERDNHSDVLQEESVEQHLKALFAPDVVLLSSSPRLVEENYKGFNLVLYGGKFHALAQALGPVDLTEIEEYTLSEYQERGMRAIANSLEEAKQLVDRLGPLSPLLVEEDYKGFNIVHYKGKFYALAQALGPVDLTQVEEHTLSEYQENGRCLIGSSLYEAKHLLDQLAYQALQQELMGIKSTRWFRVMSRINGIKGKIIRAGAWLKGFSRSRTDD